MISEIMQRASLSVVLATFNEEENLPACLDSVKDIADEIIIVDGSSSDNTCKIAKKYDAKVTVTTNPPIFHINKQKAISLASKDWVLQLDADERVTPELAKEIRLVTSRQQLATSLQPSAISGYWIPRKNWFLGRFLLKGGQYPDYTLRLYRNGKGRLPQKSVHEQAIVEGKIEYLKNPIIHMADPTFSRYLIRFDRYTNLLRDELSQENNSSSPLIAAKYMLVLPFWWFFMTYVRHKGFTDGWQGFVFSFFSSLRFPVAYIKYLRARE